MLPRFICWPPSVTRLRLCVCFFSAVHPVSPLPVHSLRLCLSLVLPGCVCVSFWLSVSVFLSLSIYVSLSTSCLIFLSRSLFLCISFSLSLSVLPFAVFSVSVCFGLVSVVSQSMAVSLLW